MPTKSHDTRLEDHSKRIKLLEEVFVPMAKTAMKVIMGENGHPGMAEDVRRLGSRLDELIDLYEKDSIETQSIRKDALDRLAKLESWRDVQNEKKEITMLGIKTSADARAAIIAGLFSVLGILISRLIP